MIYATYLHPIGGRAEPSYKVFSEFCGRNELTILSVAADRYDSWEWSALKQDDVNRFLSLLLTPKPNKRASINAHIVAEAESDEKVARRIIIHRLQRSFLSQRNAGEQLTAFLYKGWEKAKTLDRKSLKMPRHLPFPLKQTGTI